jgi:hypothetical protein
MNQRKQKTYSQAQEITWEAPEYMHRPKPLLWYIIFAISTSGLILWGVYQKSPIAVLTYIVMAAVIMFFSLKKPELVTFRLTNTGIFIGKTEHPYKVIKKFWILYNPPEIKTLNLETSGYINNTISIELGSENPIEIKYFLKQYILEDIDKEEGFAETLARKLKL